MLFKVFTVYDSKVEAYMSPFVMRSRGEAIRAWESTVNDPNTQFYKHPADFTLFEIAEWNEQKGKFENYSAPNSIGTALEFKKQLDSKGQVISL